MKDKNRVISTCAHCEDPIYKFQGAQSTPKGPMHHSCASLTDVSDAVGVLSAALKEDEGLWESYKANIAMSFVDECARFPAKYKSKAAIHGIANTAAENFLILLTR